MKALYHQGLSQDTFLISPSKTRWGQDGIQFVAMAARLMAFNYQAEDIRTFRWSQPEAIGALPLPCKMIRKGETASLPLATMASSHITSKVASNLWSSRSRDQIGRDFERLEMPSVLIEQDTAGQVTSPGLRSSEATFWIQLPESLLRTRLEKFSRRAPSVSDILGAPDEPSAACWRSSCGPTRSGH
jgi:hypothetical protein